MQRCCRRGWRGGCLDSAHNRTRTLLPRDRQPDRPDHEERGQNRRGPRQHGRPGPGAEHGLTAAARSRSRKSATHPRCRKWRNWQTHQLEGLALARVWGFESPLPHHSTRLTACLRPAARLAHGRPRRESNGVLSERSESKDHPLDSATPFAPASLMAGRRHAARTLGPAEPYVRRPSNAYPSAACANPARTPQARRRVRTLSPSRIGAGGRTPPPVLSELVREQAVNIADMLYFACGLDGLLLQPTHKDGILALQPLACPIPEIRGTDGDVWPGPGRSRYARDGQRLVQAFALQAAEAIARVFYCTVVDPRIVVLHQLVKKTARHLPTNSIARAE